MNVNVAQGTSPEQAPRRFESDPTLSGLRFTGVLRSEFAKLLALRTTFWLSLVTVGLSVLIAVAAGWSIGSFEMPAGLEIDEQVYAATALMSGLYFATMLMGALGVISMTTEFTTGAVRSSLTAVPRRSTLFIAKLLALLLVVAVVTAVSVLAAHVVGVGFTDLELSAMFTEGDVLHVYLGHWAAVLITALLGFGLGALLRSSAGGIVVLTIIVFVLQVVLVIIWQTTGEDWLETLLDYEYSSLMATFVTPGSADPEPWAGGVGLAVWAAIPTLLGWLTFTRRDA